MSRCNICNDLVFEVLPAPKITRNPRPPPPFKYFERPFVISKKAEEFKQAAASGCVPCNVVLQAIAAYKPIFKAELVPTGRMIEHQIQLSGNGNEPLRIDFWDPKGLGGLRFELFEKWDHSESHAPLFSAVGLGSTPPEVLDITYAGWRAKRWISRCDGEHECGGDDVPLLPTRVLAITSDPIKLIAPPSGTTGRFAALSYCWGSTGNLTTTLNNIKDREAGIQWETLPNLFQDVVQITRQMGIHFLWIDALCIVQDDQADWERESAKMGSIYAGAYVTIACDSAMDTSYRLTNPRNCALGPDGELAARLREPKALAPVVIDGHAHSFFVRWTLDHKSILNDPLPPSHKLWFPLNTRGWTMQERLLSSRILHVTAHEMIWECRKTYYCECGGITQDPYWQGNTAKGSFERAKAIVCSDNTTLLPNLTCPGDTPRNESFVLFWTGLMETYMKRRFTFEGDQLPGISAIARNFGLGKTYIAGLWLEDLPWHLAWTNRLGSSSMRPSVYRGPTWSWVSVSEAAIWPFEGMQLSRSQIRVMDASTAPVGLDEFGQVARGRVRLQARVAAAKVLIPEDGFPYFVTSYGKWYFMLDALGANISFAEGKIPSYQRSARTVEDHQDIWCFPVLGTGEFGDEAFRPLWIMVVAKPERQFIQRALLDPNDHPESMICERIGCIDLSLGTQQWESRQLKWFWEWLSSSDFKEKEVIII